MMKIGELEQKKGETVQNSHIEQISQLESALQTIHNENVQNIN